MFKQFQPLFSKAVHRAGIAKQVEASQQVLLAREVLQQRFGEGVMQHAEPKYVKNRVLTIASAHPAVSEEIQRQKESLIHQINIRIGRPEIIDLAFIMKKEEY